MRNAGRSIPWDCAMCGKTHEYWPNLARDVHFPTRAAAKAMGFRISSPIEKPPAAPPDMLDAMRQAASACQQRAARCTTLGLDDLAGAWTRCQADLEATAALRAKFDALPGPTHEYPVRTGLADQTEREVIDNGSDPVPAMVDGIINLFTGKVEAPHDPPKKRRGRRAV